MNYYEHHLGDYAAATGHLSWDEDMAYTRLLRAYYHHERGIPEGQQYRLARAGTPAQRRAVDAVLGEFFSLVGGHYCQKRADEEIARFQDKQRKAKASAEARWSHTERNANAYANASPDAMRTHSVGNALQSPVSRHQEETTNLPVGPARQAEALAIVPGKPKAPDCPHAAVLALWAEVLPAMPQHKPALWRGSRADHLRARWRETAAEKRWESEADGIAFMRKLFGYVGRSRFLTGKSKSADGRAPFQCELAWLVEPMNWAKVIEGKYHEEAA